MRPLAKLITIEGGDGSGKSTLLGRLEAHLRQKLSQPLVVTREPGGTPAGEQIRELILKKPAPGETAITPMTELLLYEAARAEHVFKVIRPALERGSHVLCDRYTYSSLAYQGAARGLGLELVKDLNRMATGGLEPDAVIWLKLSPAEGRKRLLARPGETTRLDDEREAFHQLVHHAFEKLAADEPARFIVLNATRSPDEVFQDCLNHPTWKRLFPGQAK